MSSCIEEEWNGKEVQDAPGLDMCRCSSKITPIITLLVTPKEGRRVKMHALEMVGVL